jgi:hypothetical protein
LPSVVAVLSCWPAKKIAANPVMAGRAARLGGAGSRDKAGGNPGVGRRMSGQPWNLCLHSGGQGRRFRKLADGESFCPGRRGSAGTAERRWPSEPGECQVSLAGAAGANFATCGPGLTGAGGAGE